jgi:hypothetical protein
MDDSFNENVKAGEMPTQTDMESMDVFIDENIVSLNIDLKEEILFDEYTDIVVKGFHDFYNLRVNHSSVKRIKSLENELFVYQPLNGSGNNHFLVGFSGSYDALMALAADLHKQLRMNSAIPAFENNREDMIDLYLETLNNINSSCSYKFNVDFGLDIPEYTENAVLTAPHIYTAHFYVFDHIINVFLINGKTHRFEGEGK